MENPFISIEDKKEENEIFLITFNLENERYNCDMYIINEKVIKFLIVDNNNKMNKYEKEYTLADFISINKYFKMFDDMEELSNELIEIIKEKKIKFVSCQDNNFILQININKRNNNIIQLNFPKVEVKLKDKFNLILIEISELKESNKSKDNEINDLKKKIENLEKENLKLKNYVDEKFKELENDISQMNKLKNIDYQSQIFIDNSEIYFILSNIQNNPKSLKLLYSSDKDGENEEKLKNSYTGKNDVLVLVKTKENKRFGGYAHEKFQENEFDKSDLKAFLFNLDSKNIYKSCGSQTTIWKHVGFLDSINFGTGTDLRIFHKFFSNQCYTSPTNDYNYNGENYSLNGKKLFDVLVLELYQADFNK